MSKYSRRTPEVFILAEEPAHEQIIDLLEYYDIDVAASGDEKAVAGMEAVLDTLTTFVRRGVLEVKWDAKGKIEVLHTLSTGDTLTYHEINSQAKLAMEKFDAKAGYSRVYAFMGSLCGLGKTAIEKLSAKDLNVVEILGTVFITA